MREVRHASVNLGAICSAAPRKCLIAASYGVGETLGGWPTIRRKTTRKFD
jgi:hypothetical protein